MIPRPSQGRRSPRPFSLAIALLLPVVLTAGCGESPAGPPSIDGIEVNAVVLLGDDGSFIYSHDDHWHGAPAVRVGETVTYSVYLSAVRTDASDHDPPPTESWFTLQDHPDYRFETVFEDPSLVTWSLVGARGTLTGVLAGASRVSFVVKRGPTTVHEAPPLNFRVREVEGLAASGAP